MSDTKKDNFYWPDVSTLEAAKSATKGAMFVAIFVATVTAAFALYGMYNDPILGIDGWAFVDSFIFILIAFGLWKLSRFAAVFGVLFYILEQVDMWLTNPSVPILAVIFTLVLIGGVRGTFSYHKLKSQAVKVSEPAA
ncbi:hypothetical protein [Colwellia sp. 12G3]|uniref:hypothetical protein n=1 Tax=Colwellia sp. 12G3 TaxID=2058299 RepID=UPI000C32BFAB|nr:hypothetical protein [Colwellia sp. 12G3]PKI16315.1 hypothetical protein CXF71_09960 [Colwellia sp. 12G3]